MNREADTTENSIWFITIGLFNLFLFNELMIERRLQCSLMGGKQIWEI